MGGVTSPINCGLPVRGGRPHEGEEEGEVQRQHHTDQTHTLPRLFWELLAPNVSHKCASLRSSMCSWAHILTHPTRTLVLVSGN